MRALPPMKLHRRAVIGACACLVAAFLPGGALADRKVAIGPADLERLLSRIKVQYPSASILKVEREAEGDGARGVYEVKLLQSDGRVLKLYFDAASLEPVTRAGDGEGSPEQRRRRERHRGQW